MRVRRTISAICFMLDVVTKTPSRCGNEPRSLIRRSRLFGAIWASRISILPEMTRRLALRLRRRSPRIRWILGLYERDQLWKRVGERPEVRLAELERHLGLAGTRDDLSVELASLYNQTRRHDKALAIVRSRKFQPWEGGEGLALGQHVRTHLALGRRALQEGRADEARRLFEAALDAPENLGEAKHPLANQSDIYYWNGVALDAGGDTLAARHSWEQASAHRGDFQLMRVTSFSEMSYYNGLALLRLGRLEEANDLLQRLVEFAVALRTEEPKFDYFATSLPQMLLFEDDARKRNAVRGDFIEAQARIGLGDVAAGRELLDRVLTADPNNAYAADSIAELELQSQAARSGHS